MSKKAASKYAKEVGGYKDRFWYPRIWNGLNMGGLFKLCARNSFAIAPYRWPMTAIMCGTSATNTVLHALQALFMGGSIRRTEIQKDPVFIIGHWRSGTTFLHELFVQDPNNAYPDCYSCFSPNHFVSTRWLFPNIVYLPSKRPMDNVAMGWTSPQEDEFALCNMGIPSPYINLAFPNNCRKDVEYLAMRDVSESEKKRWKDAMHWFMQCLTYTNNGKRLVLKSPTHTARVKIIRELYPTARFVHIHRNPLTLFPSTVNLWYRLAVDNGFQYPKNEWDNYVFDLFERMYSAFWEDSQDLPENQLVNISFKELTGSPVESMEKIYNQLELGGFEDARAPLTAFCESKKDHKKNKYEIDVELQKRIMDHPIWRLYMEKYGYAEN